VLDGEALAEYLGLEPCSDRAEWTAHVLFLHELALCLSGSYNDEGVKRWFLRKRAALQGCTAADFLRGDWQVNAAAVQIVRDLAVSLRS
jgi:hypothetical protein